MKTPGQIREENIKTLVEAFKNKNVTKIDTIIEKASELFPYIKEATIRSYAGAAYKILKAKKKTKEQEEKEAK